MSFWGFQGHIYVTGLLGHVPYVLVVLTLKEGPGGRNGDIPGNKRGTLLRASPLFPLASPSCVPNPSHTPVGAHKRRRLGQWGACYGPLPFCPWLLFQPLQRICIWQRLLPGRQSFQYFIYLIGLHQFLPQGVFDCCDEVIILEITATLTLSDEMDLIFSYTTTALSALCRSVILFTHCCGVWHVFRDLLHRRLSNIFCWTADDAPAFLIGLVNIQNIEVQYYWPHNNFIAILLTHWVVHVNDRKPREICPSNFKNKWFWFICACVCVRLWIFQYRILPPHFVSFVHF